MIEIKPQNSIGLNRIALYETNNIFGPSHTISRTYIEYSHNIGYHAHTFYEMNIVLTGEGVHYIEDKAYQVSKGDVFVIPPNHRHAYRSSGNFNVYNFIFNPKFFEKYLPELEPLPYFSTLFELEPLMRARGGSFRHLVLDDRMIAKVSSQLDDLSRIDQSRPETELLAACYTMIVISEMCMEYGKAADLLQDDETENDRYFADSVAMIYERYRTKLPTEELAAVAHLSRSAYIRKFTDIIGMPPRRFIMNERIKAAKNLLATTDMPITAISDELGFYDNSHFTKSFATATGMTPAAYRDSERMSKRRM